MPVGRHPIAHAGNPLATLLPHIQEVREVARLLELDALRWGQKGDVENALRSAAGAFNAGRSFGDEPFIISQLVRIACIGMASSAIERALALGEPSEKTLSGLQSLVEQEESHPTLASALRGERALQHEILVGLTNGSMPTKSLFADFPNGFRWDELMRRWEGTGAIRREHPQVLKLISKAIDNARLPAHEQPAAAKVLQEKIARMPPRSTTLTRALLPATDRYAVAGQRKLATVRCLKVLLALERQRLRTGAWPAKLTELTPQLLVSVPEDPFDGKPLRYRVLPGGAVVYSVGPDGKDDGGLVASGPGRAAKDIGLRLWDVKARRTAPVPAK
jgi:hypothetical protein